MDLRGLRLKATSGNETFGGGPTADGRVDNQKSRFDTLRHLTPCGTPASFHNGLRAMEAPRIEGNVYLR